MQRIKNYKDLNTSPERKIVLDLTEAALDSIDPINVFKKHFELSGNILRVQDRKIDLSQYKRIFLLGFGKGSAKNSQIVESILADRLSAGFVIDVTSEKFSKVRSTLGTHPVTSQTNVDFTQKVIAELSNLNEKDLVLIVTCGGGSALFELPTIPLKKSEEVQEALLEAGANIHDMNVVRKHLSKVKGGDLAQIINPAKIVNLIFSDVPGNDLTTIASGPTVADPTTQEDAWRTYNKYNLEDKVPLKKDDFTKTVSDKKIFENVDNILFLSNLTALAAMKKKAKSLGADARIYSDQFQAHAHEAGVLLINETKRSEILLVGGETILKVEGSGEGGRNQELVLAALAHVDEDIVISSFDSDGWDNSEFAGAIGDAQTIKAMNNLNLDPQVFLNRNDSLNFFKKVGGGIETERLPSNVSDLMIVFRL